MKIQHKKKEFIFEDKRPFGSCHASTLAVLPNGDTLAAWFGGSQEGAEDVAIWFAKRTGGKWSYPLKAADREGIPHWNPVLFLSHDRSVFLFYKIGHRIREWSTMFTVSTDDGETWSET